MNVPALPWQPHIPTLAWLFGILIVAGLVVVIVIQVRRAQEGG